MLYVKALAGDTWPSAPSSPSPSSRLDKTLVRALEHGIWGVNGAPVARLPRPRGQLP